MRTRPSWVWLLAVLGSAAKVSRVSPARGSVSGGTYVVLSGTGFRHPAGPDPFGHQTVHFGDRPCAVLEAETSGEQLVCETSAGLAGGPALPVCLRLSAAGPCEPACESCSFQYAEEETPYISWLSARGFCGGDSVALGAAAPQALLVAQLDRAVVEIGGYICDASEGQVLNSDDLLVQGRTVNCVLPSTGLGPRLARVQLRALARGWQDPGCANFPCLEGGEDERGLGLAAYRTWQGGAELAPAFVDRGFQLYDLTIFPQIANVTPGSVGVLGGTLLHIAGKSFDEEISRNVVTVADEPCRVLSAGPDGLTCELDDVQGNLSCVELELYAGASPHASEKFLEHDGDLSSCRVEQLADGRSFSVAVNASESYGYYWVEDSCQADGRHVRGHLAEESEERLTFCCTLNGSSCVGPRYGQVTTSIPSYWQGWGSWVQMGGGTTTPDPLFGTCLPPTSHKEAELTCQLTGMRLCSKVELNSGLCCAADCFGDGSATIGAWSSDSGQRQQLAVSADDGQPWTEELYIRCEETCRFPFNITFPGNGTTTTTTRYTPEQLALWEFAPWLRPADFVPPTQAEEETLPLGPPVPEPLLPPSPPLLAPFAGGRGLLYKVYSNSENLPVHRALGHENAAYPQSPMASGVLPDMLRGAFRHVRFAPVPATAVSARRSYVPEPPLSDDTGHDLYAEEIVGFFVAPFTASYIFYLAADDEADLSISCCGDMAGMKVEVKASRRDYPMPRYTPLAWFGACEAGMDVPCSISAPHHFRAGEQTLLRVRHRDNVAGDWLRVGLRIHNALAHDGSTVPAELVRRKSIVEVQRLTLTASVVRERHQLNFYRILTGSFRIHVRRYARNFLREGTSDSLRYGDTADQFATALWATQDLYGRVLECQPTVERQQSGERISYVVTFPCPQPEDGNSHAALQLVPGLDVIGTSVLSWVMNSSKLQTSSGLVRGSFRLYFGRGWTEALPYYGWAQVQSELTRLPGLAAVTTWPLQEVQQGGREGWSVGLLLPGAGGGEDMPQIQVDASELSGPGVHLTVDTLANGSSDLFLEEIPADWFRTPHSQQQVVVESNGVRAAGLGEAGAALRRSEDFTPRLMELSPWRVQVGAEVILRLDRVDGNHLRSLKIAPFTLMIGPVLCNMTSFSCENGEERNCGAYPEVWNARCTVPDGRAGQHAVQVLVEGQGRAQYTNVTVALPVPVIDYVPELHLVRPGRGSWAGGTVVLLAGFGLQGPEACQLIHFGASALLEVPMDYFEEEMVPELPGRLLRCLTPPAPEVPEACEISPGFGDCGPAEDLVVPVTVAGYATDWSFNYSSDVTPLVSAISPQRSAAMSGMVSLQGARFPPLRGGRAADPVVVYIGSQRCRPEESTGASLRCFLLRHPPVPSGQSAVGLWVLGLGFAVVTPSTRFSHPFAVTEVSPASGSWHGGALLEIRGEGFHAESARHEVLLRLAVNGSQDLPCPLLPGPTLGRRLQCQAPALTEELLHHVRTAQEGGLEEILGRVTVRLNGIESSCGGEDDGEGEGCVYSFARRSTPSVVEVAPLHGQTLEEEVPLVRIIVAGWDGMSPDLPEVYFGSQQCDVNLTKRLVQRCPDCGQGHCISNVLTADMADASGQGGEPPVACKCQDGWHGENCRHPCTCVYPGTVSCADGAQGDGSCTCVDLHNGTNCEMCDAGYYRSRADGFCDTFCDRNDTCSGSGSCTQRGQCQCDLWYFGEHCDCSCNGHGICDDGVCKCDVRWEGEFCDEPSASNASCGNCSARGICGDGCECLEGFYGENCERSCGDCEEESTVSCDLGFCFCREGFWGPKCERQCECGALGTSSCDFTSGACSCREGWQGTSCSECAPNYYPQGQCDVFCEGSSTCGGFGECNDEGACLCFGSRSAESYCRTCLSHYYPAEDATLILGIPDPPEIFVEELREVEVDCPGPGEDDDNDSDDFNASNASNASNDSNGSVGSGVPRCLVNMTVNVSVNTTDLVEPDLLLIPACSRHCDPATTCSGNGVCDPITAECICDSQHFSSDCSGICSDHCDVTGTLTCALPEGQSVPVCTCRPGYWDSDCRWSCSCTESGTLRCNDGSTGDGACQCKSGFIGFSCDSCAAYMYPPGECFRRCEEGVDCFQGSCTPYTGICECEVGWEGSNCGCSVDMSPGDSCGGRGFCASDGACICDVRFDGGECAASKSYQLAEADCPYCNNNGICVEESVQDSSQFVCSCAKKLGYYGNNCEVFCSSCNPLTTRTCAVMSQVEQCYCEEWWWGQDCSRPCACIRAGSKQCLMQTGQCECKEGWAGVYCEQCAPGYYPEGACDVQCDFGTTCHLNGICGPQGTCLCNDLWDGEGCTLCTGDGLPKVEDNTSSMPPLMPPCSTRCSDATCNGHGACTDVGLCDCDPGWYGGPVACWDAALADLRGWYRSLPALPDCDFVMPLGAAFRTECHQQCTCTSPGTHFCREGRTGDGLCVCHSGWGGDNCERCAEGFFPAPSTASPACTTFCSDWSTCGGHGTCNPFGICQCDQGWAGKNCDHCEENWYPLGACDVYCTPEETCSHHGVCSSYGLCLCEDGWTTGLRSRFRFAGQELGALPLGNSSEDELWQCLLSCSMELGVDADLDDCVELCMDPPTTSTSGPLDEANETAENETDREVGVMQRSVKNETNESAANAESENRSFNASDSDYKDSFEESDSDNETSDGTTATSTTSYTSTTSSTSSTSTSSSTTSSSSSTSTSTSTSSSSTSSSSSSTSTSTSTSSSSSSSTSSTSSSTSSTSVTSSTTTFTFYNGTVNMSELELCLAACKEAWALSANFSANLTAEIAAGCLKRCVVNGTVSIDGPSALVKSCDVLDVTLLRVAPCATAAGLHDVLVKPTALGFADLASRTFASFKIMQELKVINLEPFGGPVAGGKVVTVSGIGFPDVHRAHIFFEEVGPCKVIESTSREIKCLTPHLSPWRFQQLWNASARSFAHSDGTLALPAPVRMVVGDLTTALVAAHGKCLTELQELQGYSFEACARTCISGFIAGTCFGFSHGFRGSALQVCSLVLHPEGCHTWVPDPEFHSYTIRDADSNGSSPAVWPMVTVTATTTTFTRTTVTSTEGNTTSTTSTTTSSTSTTRSTSSSSSSTSSTFSTSTATTVTSTQTSSTSSTWTNTSSTQTSTSITTSSTTSTVTGTTSTQSSTSSSSATSVTSSTATSSSETSSTATATSGTSTSSGTSTTAVSTTRTTSTTQTRTSSTATSSTITATSITSSSSSTTSATSTSSTTTTTTTSLDPNDVVFLVEAYGPEATGVLPDHGPAGTEIAVAGSSFGEENGTVHLAEPGTADAFSELQCELLHWQDTSVLCRLPALPAGVYEVRVRVPGLGDAVVPVPFLVPLQLRAGGLAQHAQLLRTANAEDRDLFLNLEGSMAGGQELLFFGQGLGDQARVSVCGAPCDVQSASTTELTCRTTQMFTDAEELEDLPPQDLRKFAEQISISGSPFRPEELARLMDGELDADAEFESCTVEFYAGLDRYFRVTDLAFFSPTEAEHREQLVGSYFQAGRHQVLGNMTYEEEEVVELVEEDCNESNESNSSNDSNASNFSNCFTPRVRVPRSDPGFWTIDTRPGTGWSTRSLQPPLMAQRLWLQGAGGCRLREVEIRGYIASSLCHIEVSHPALGASREAALSRLAWSDGAVVVGAVGNEELRLAPGGWVSFRLRVGAEQPELELEVGVLEPGKPQTLRMMAYAPHAGPDDLGGSDAMAMAELHLREGSMTWRSAALTLGPGLWTVRLATEGSHVHLGRLRSDTPGVDFLLRSQVLGEASPMARYTPFVSSIDPVEGPYGGGTTVMLSGSGFLCNGTATMEELSVMLAGSPCVLLHATDTEATCVTSAAKGLGGDAVEIMQTCGQGLTASGVGFSYVTRWSQPSDWPEEEPPILSEELLIPAGSHVILDVQSGALSLLRVEGHLEVDLSRQDLVLESERIWLRGGRLTAEPDRNSSFSIHMAESEVVSPEVPGLGHLQLLVTDRQTENSAWPEAQGSLHLGAPLQSHRSSLLAHPVKSGSQVLELREALDLDLGDQVLVMGGSHSAPELHEVTWLEDGGRILHLAAPLAFDREGGTRGLDAIIDEVFFNFGQVDLSATVASLRGSAFSTAAGGGSLRCASGGSCGVQGMVFSGCGQVSTGTAGLPCLTMRAVQEPHAAYVKQSAFLNAEGPAVLVQANSGTAEFSENVVMSPKGPGVTVSTLRGAVAPKAAVTVHGNQVVSPRTSAVGLPWFQHPVAFDMKTSAYYTENFASGAEACFLFDPREDSTETGVAVGLARFHGNVAHACTYGLLVVELREGETKVFDQFTVFASDYGAYVHGCDRCRLVNWAWVECNMGIFDKDSAPVVTDDPWIENATAVGTRQMFGAFEVNLGPQVMLSEREGRRIRNMTFFLFGNSPCVHGGFRPVTVRTEAMRFIQSFVEIYTLAPAGYAIFADLDGSLSGQRGGFVTGDKIYNRHSSCTSAGSDASRRLLCSSDIFVRALKITGVQPAELVGTDLVVWSIFGTGNVPYTDGWHFTVVGAVQREDFVWPLRRWAETGPTPVEWRMLPFWYTLKADSHLDWQRLRVSYGAPGVMTKSEWVGFHFTYRQTPVRQFEAIGVSGSCFEPYYDWLDRGGYALWAPEILFTTTRTLTSTVTLTSSTTFTSTSSITSTTTQSTTSSTTTFELMDDNDTNDTNESNETNITTTTSTVTTSTSTTATNTSTTTMTTTSSSSTVSSTITTSSTSQTTTSRSSTTTTTSYLGSRTSTSTETTITMTTTTTSTSTTVPLAAPLRTLSVFPEPRFGCGALSFQFEFCERAGGLPYGPCLPDGPVVGWTNFTEMVNSTLFANGTVAVMIANSEQGDFQNPLVADLVNTGCGEGGCAFVEEARVVMGPPGNWTLPESWPGRQLPIGMDQLVVIPPYYHIVYNNFTAIGMVGDLKVYGKLSMAEEEGLKLLVKSIQVHAGGVMQVGTSYAPHRTTAIISFWGVTYDSFPAYISTNTEWGRKVFGVYEGNVSLHGKAYTHSWGELFVTAEPGDEMIRVREDVGDWPVGSEIALTTNEYPSLNGTFTERRFIVSIVFYPPSTEIVLDRPLHHRHFAGKAFEDSSGTLNIHSKVALLSRSILVTTEEAFTGAERFPDAERGVPIAGHGGEWFGQHMVVSGASFLSMSWVQLNRGGQDGLGLTRFPALRVFQPEIYTRNLPRPYLEAVSFTDSYIRALEVVGSWGLDLLDSVFCSTRGPALEAGVDMGSFFLLRNLAIDTRPEPPGAELGLTYEPTAVFQLQARPTVFAGNVVAGGPDIGVMMRPHTCEEVAEAPEPEMNEVFGCVVGFFVLRSCVTEGGGPAACPQSWDCVHITKLQAWKNAHVGILFVDQPANMIISDVKVFDNHIGITGIFHRQMGDMLHSFILRDSKVYGSTELSSCQASLQCLAVGPNDARPERCHSVPGPSFRRVGILLPIITNRGKTCEDGPVLRACPMAILPERDCAMPWELRYGNRGSRMSSQRIEDVYFGGFQPEDCGLRSVAIAYNPSSRDFNPPLDVRGLKWAEAPIFSKTVTNYSLKMEGPTARSHPDYVNSRILLEPWTGYQGEGSCGEPTLSEAVRRKLGVEGELPFCPGMQQTWLRDVDASLLNAGPVVLLPTQSLLPAQCDVTSSDFVGTTLVPSALPPPCEQCGGTWAHTLDGGLTACADRMRMLNWESLDPDCCGFYRRELGMLRATRPDGAYEETWPMFDESCPRGLEYGRSSYIIRVEAGLSLELRFLGSSRLPRLSRLHFFAESVQDEVLLQIPLGRLRRPRLYIFGINFDIMRRTAIPNVGDSHGAMFLDRDLLRLYVMVRGMPGGLQGQGVLLQLLEVFEAEVVVFVPLEEFSEFVFVADVSRSLNVSQDRVALVDIRYDGQKWLAGPNGRRLEMVDTLRIKFEVSEDPDSLSAFALSDRAWDPPGAYNAFFEDNVQSQPAEAEAISGIRNLSTTFLARGVAGLNFTWPVAELHVASVPEMPSTSITRLSCGVDLQGNQVCMCDAGWYGPQCDQLCNCTGAGIARCNEGPEGDGSCICKDGYLGERCDQCKQYYYNLENGCAIYCHPDDYCNGHGECTTHPVTHQINGCQCYQEWAGDDCRLCAPGYYPSRVCNVYCTKNTTCSGKGECNDFGACQCEPGHRGQHCELCEEDYYPPGGCTRRCHTGNCIGGKCDIEGFCQCYPGWYGTTCSVSCPRCSQEGSFGCDEGREGNGTCICRVGFDGPSCSDPAEYHLTEWSTCEGTCGGNSGARTRLVRCYNSRSRAILPDSKCPGEKPVSQEVCVTPLCSCKEPPMLGSSDYTETMRRCPFLQNGQTCNIVCSEFYVRTGAYKCVGSRYVELPICLPLGDVAEVREAMFSYVTLAGVDLSVVVNLTWWYDSISASLRQVLADKMVPPGTGQRLTVEQVTFRPWYEVDMPAPSRRLEGDDSFERLLQGNMVALEVPFTLEAEDSYTFIVAENMLKFFAGSRAAAETALLQALEEKLEELCFTVLPDLRPMRCTAPNMILVGEPVRISLYLPPTTTTTTPFSTTTRAPIIERLQEGVPAWAVALIIVLLVMVGLCGSFVVKLRQQKLRKEAQIQRLKEKNFVDTRSEEQKVHDLWMEALTDEKGHFITGYKELQLPDGSLYSGQLENGDPQGVGKMIWPDGRTFRGKWLRGQPHGHGVMCSMAPQDMEYDTWVYCGQFTDGLRNGVGRCEWPAVGSWYEGDWLMDGEHGLGELGAGATESQDGDPQIWSMYNGEKQENVAQSRVVPGLDDELMVVVLQAAKDLKLSELDDTELLLPRYGMAVGNPHVWIPRHEHAFLVTWIEEEGPLDAWNRAQLRQAGPGAKVVLPNCTVWSVNGIRGNISKMTEELLSPTQTSLTLEVWCPAHQRLDSMRDDLAKRAGWFRTPGDQMNFVGLRWTQKSKHARELETARPWMKTALNVPNVEAHTETRSGLERSPARMTDRPGLPALLRMPEVPAPPTHLVASVTLKASKAEAALPSPTSLSKEAPRSKVEAPVPKLRWPQAPPAPSEAPPAAAPFVEEQDERLRRVAEATTPPMSPH